MTDNEQDDIDWAALDEELEANLDEYMTEWQESLEEVMRKGEEE